MHDTHTFGPPRRLLPSISLLSAFEAVCRTGSTAAAARELALTQGAISRLVQNLEAQLQVQLFRRERRRLVPTGAALAYAREVRKALDLIARSSLGLRANPGSGILSLAILPTFGTRWLAPRLQGFLDAHPGVTINLGTRPDPFDFTRDSFDAAIHFGDADWPDADWVELFPERMIACCAPEAMAKHKFASASDVSRLPLLMLESRPGAWDSWFRFHGATPPAQTRGMLFDQFATMLQAAIHGMGAALLPEFLAAAEIEQGRLAPAFGDPVSGVGSYYLVWPRPAVAHEPLSAFREWLVAETVELRRGGWHQTST